MRLELSPRKYDQIFGMLEAGLSQCVVAIRLGVSKGANYRTLQREKLHSSQCSPSKTDRPVAMDTRDHRRLAREILSNPGKPWAYLATIFMTSADSVSKAANSLEFSRDTSAASPS
jgi:hypothetical protein